MSSPPTSSRHRTFDLPKSSPDAGLAEWTSKIKAIQQEVDRDEEREQRSLQEEITRSRMERAKRRNTATGSIDWTKQAHSPSDEAPANDAQSAEDRRQNQLHALRKLGRSVSPAQSPGAAVPLVSPSAPSGPTSKPEAISLAAFMGGRASGPMLRKPIPQQDSHDAALFDQTRREGPHPIFGQKSDAAAAGGRFPPPGMPKSLGMSSEKLKEPSDQGSLKSSESKTSVVSSPPILTSKEQASATERMSPEIPAKPAIYRKPSNQAIRNLDTTQAAGSSAQVRTPPHAPVKPPSLHRRPTEGIQPSKETARVVPADSVSSKPTSLAEMMGGRASGPRLNKQVSRDGDEETPDPSSRSSLGRQGRALPGMTGAQPANSPPMWSSNVTSTSPKPTLSRPLSEQGHRSDSSSNPTSPQTRSFSGSKIVTPSLARPVQPQVIVQPSPIAATSTSASPAFLRTPPTTQDLHPSLGRLQGRGFVNQRVKASSELFGSPTLEQKERSTSLGSSAKRATVLDRWQPAVASPSPSPISTPPKSLNKGQMAEVPIIVAQPLSVEQSTRPRITSPGLVKIKAPNVEETNRETVAPVRLPGMTPPTSLPPTQLTHRHKVDEGNAPSDHAGVTERSHEKTVSPALLNHPTRDRARKPRKPQASSKPRELNPPQQEPRVEISHVSHNQHANEVLPAGPADRTTEHERPRRIPSPETRRRPSPSVESNLNRLKDELIYRPAIGMKETGNLSSDTAFSNGASSTQAAGRRALPGLTSPIPAPSTAPRPRTPASPTSSPEEAPSTPSRHSRIPSTGQRATVMDVAQALQEHEQHIRESSWASEPELVEKPSPPAHEEEIDETPRPDVKAVIAGWGRNIGSGVQQSERRRSIYSVNTLPPLTEEKTPTPTPHGSLSRGFAQVDDPPSSVLEIHQNLLDSASLKDKPSEPAVPIVPDPVAELEEPLIHLEHQDNPPPAFNLQSILRETSYSPELNVQTISVEVLSIAGHTATAVTREPNVFYDSEVIAVVHRGKAKAGGLVSTKVWVWLGKHADFGENEEHKVNGLAERFGTTCSRCAQGSELPELIHVLGGVLAIRQGVRVHWTVENTAMHRVHCIGDSIFVDEVDLAISNLCSAYSYCLSVLDALYVWHGRGASEDERKVASAYAQSLNTGSMNISEFEEGGEDEMFWMMLGDEGFANADHWKFRNQMERLGSRLYIINSSKPKSPVQLVPSCSGWELRAEDVFLVDCRFELFLVVTPRARGKRTDIQLGLFLAENISAAEAGKRPFDPPIHVVILPGKLPLEISSAIRLFDEEKLNGGPVPDHMNLLTLSEALDQMRQRSWSKSVLSDPNFLPLGVEPGMF